MIYIESKNIVLDLVFLNNMFFAICDNSIFIPNFLINFMFRTRHIVREHRSKLGKTDTTI